MDSTSSPRLRILPTTLTPDAAVAVLLAVMALAEIAIDPPDDRIGLAVSGALLATLPLAWRTAAPPLIALVTTGGMLIAGVDAGDDLAVVTAFSPLIALYTLGEQSTPRTVARAAPVVALAWMGMGVLDKDAGGGMFGLALSIGAITVGVAVRALDFQTDLLTARVGDLENEREENARRAVALERERISRELHDIIGHSISVMGIQAGAVRRVLPPEFERERELLLSIERTGRDSVTEMRRLIDLLRASDEVPDDALPTLARLPALVDDMRLAGLDVTLEFDIDADEDRSPGLELAAYRIAQEALTNALKHAPRAPVRITARGTAAGIDINVRSGAGPDRAERTDGGGRGLVGMRERVGIYGGTLTAGATEDGGFQVLASLPAEGH